jgi:simple sugar transport system ATP-binding protein
VTHFLDQVYEVSDRITVLRNGKKVAEGECAALSKMELVRAMTGRDPSEFEGRAVKELEEPGSLPVLLSAEGLGRSRTVQGVSLKIGAGETVGFAGLLGSGRTETIRLLYGIDRADRGVLSPGGRRHSVRRAIKSGLGLCPEDRKAQGILPQLSVRENVLLALQAKRGWFRPLSRRLGTLIVERLIAQLRVATPDIEKPIDQLSGGNQQKVLLARWLAAEPRLLLLDEPTRGIDVGAKFEIMSEIERLRAGGMAFVFVSSEIPEVVRASGQVAVFRDRKQVAHLEGSGISEKELMRLLAEGAD